MNCKIIGRVTDSYKEEYTSKKTGKVINNNVVTIIDEDAYSTKDRYFKVVIPENIKGIELVGKNILFEGTLSMSFGQLAFSANRLEPYVQK